MIMWAHLILNPGIFDSQKEQKDLFIILLFPMSVCFGSRPPGLHYSDIPVNTHIEFLKQWTIFTKLASPQKSKINFSFGQFSC